MISLFLFLGSTILLYPKLVTQRYDKYSTLLLLEKSFDNPIIENREKLFNLPNFDKGNFQYIRRNYSISTSELPSGLKRLQQKETRIIKNNNNIENNNEIFEEIETFRFVVDKNQLQNAINRGQSIRVKQLDSTNNEIENDFPTNLFLDSSIIKSLMDSDEDIQEIVTINDNVSIDDNNNNNNNNNNSKVKNIKRIEIDFDEFKRKLYTNDNEDTNKYILNNKSNSITTSNIIEMNDANKLITTNINNQKEKQILNNDIIMKNNITKNNKIHLSKIAIFRIVIRSAYEYILLLPRKELISDLYSSLMVTLCSYTILSSYSIIINYINTLLSIVLKYNKIILSNFPSMITKYLMKYNHRAIPYIFILSYLLLFMNYIYLPRYEMKKYNWITNQK